jgi:hypothetical protein
MGQEMLQLLIDGLRHCFGHPLHVLPPGLHQAAEVLLGLGDHASGARAEMWREACDDGNETFSQPLQRLG